MRDHSLFDRDASILVIGDVMLDGYSSGSVERLSPEAPVPVLRNVSRKDVPGGGANVAMNIAALGGRPHLIGLIGQDADGRRLEALLGEGGVSTRLIAATDRPTTSKLRILATHQQIVRIDTEQTGPADAAAEEELLAAIAALMPSMRAVVLSDYCKGCLSDRVLRAAIAQATELGLPIFVDPKRVDFAAYAGATFITPNRSELARATAMACGHDDECRSAADRAKALTGASILLTRSEQGMSLFPVEGAEILLPTHTQEIFDVSGAGDTVVAAFALSIVSGHNPAQALRLANHAAGVVVGKPGTATVTQAELATVIDQDHPVPGANGSVSWADAASFRKQWKEQGLRVGFTNGCFDLLHPGHIALLRQSAAHCDRLIVGLNSDASVRRLKGASRPVQSEVARAEVMAAIGHVDLVVIFDEDTPCELIETLKPDLLVKGSDYTEDQIVGADIVKALGGRILRVDLRAGHSTTDMIDRAHRPQDAAA